MVKRISKNINIYVLNTMVVLLLVSISLEAHNSTISAVNLVYSDMNRWNGYITVSHSAVQTELSNAYPGLDFEKLDPETYVSLIEEHMRSHISLFTPETTDITLGDFLIRPGHETYIMFQLNGLPKQVDELNIKYDCFAQNKNHVAALYIKTEGVVEKFYFNDKNGYSLNLKRGELGILQHKAEQNSLFSWFSSIEALYGVIISVFMLAIFAAISWHINKPSLAFVSKYGQDG